MNNKKIKIKKKLPSYHNYNDGWWKERAWNLWESRVSGSGIYKKINWLLWTELVEAHLCWWTLEPGLWVPILTLECPPILHAQKSQGQQANWRCFQDAVWPLGRFVPSFLKEGTIPLPVSHICIGDKVLEAVTFGDIPCSNGLVVYNRSRSHHLDPYQRHRISSWFGVRLPSWQSCH
jgi:hypothetical protein